MQEEKRDLLSAQTAEPKEKADTLNHINTAASTDKFFAKDEIDGLAAEPETEMESEDFAEAEKTERELRELKEAKKMKFRKVLYPIAIILIIALWASNFLQK